MEEKPTITIRKKITRLVISLIVIYSILWLIYQMARYQTLAFVLGAITGILIGVWVFVAYGRLQIEDFHDMQETQDTILEQNMVLIMALQKIGAIEKDDSEDLR